MHQSILTICCEIIRSIDPPIQFLTLHQQTVIVQPSMIKLKFHKIVDQIHIKECSSMIVTQILVKTMLLMKECQINIAKQDSLLKNMIIT